MTNQISILTDLELDAVVGGTFWCSEGRRD